MFKDKVELSGSLETEKTKLDDLIQQMRGGGGLMRTEVMQSNEF